VVLSGSSALILGVRDGDWTAGVLAGIALAIALVPEEMPVVLSVYSVLGARRMARHRALARRFGTIPTLGAVTVLCTDKTGTVTQNRMEVAKISFDPTAPAEAPLVAGKTLAGARLLAFGFLSSDSASIDPMETALAEIGRSSVTQELIPRATTLSRRYAFDGARMYGATTWADTETAAPTVGALKGAPEALLDRAGGPPEVRDRWEARVREMARDGLRVLGVARSVASGAPLAEDPAL
jgi:Ca2+-transporting ATPase